MPIMEIVEKCYMNKHHVSGREINWSSHSALPACSSHPLPHILSSENSYILPKKSSHKTYNHIPTTDQLVVIEVDGMEVVDYTGEGWPGEGDGVQPQQLVTKEVPLCAALKVPKTSTEPSETHLSKEYIYILQVPLRSQ